ncbi:hypothetical protein COCOBI_02-0920 [Coccomyxa sp. Obi]|nr:hypothetical protein COCOBI_02-0920 [Coccomyxa sp. Obi]
MVKVEVAANPARARAPTAASAAPATPVPRAFKAVHGYTTADILKDKRFKVLEALRQCNLDRSPHAGSVLAGMS